MSGGLWLNFTIVQLDIILGAATDGREPALSEVEGNLTPPDVVDGVDWESRCFRQYRRSSNPYNRCLGFVRSLNPQVRNLRSSHYRLADG